MGFRIEADDRSLAAALRRIAAERGATARMRSQELPQDEAIHELRKDVKALRALLRLARPGLPEFKAENRALRDAARALSGRRDAAVRLDCFTGLSGRYAREIDRRSLTPLRRALSRDAEKAAGAEAGRELSALAEAIESHSRRAAGFKLEAKSRKVLRAGLKRSLRRGAAALEAAEADGGGSGGGEALHELRKRAKDHRAQMKLMRPLWPKAVRAREKAAKRLGDLLGDHHDLDALCEYTEARALPRDIEARQALQALAARRQAEIAEEAMPIARRLFGGGAKRQAKEAARLWKLWRRETAASRAD
ncbi:CHAD domain-containing protein [Limimaricola pyoseonensis]|uniref:CHAD domain-containing protein n=1 Tax=Limimaricola pyoseonensis TaxID=521013 RepID=A0A1G7G5T3_9RHOB|nr:CHAD domain-containing protein [Limimaricola pyoseonensis]SDE83389.1 CHAD domain-containing protein [Limimaricola pyoseonensis]